MTYILKTDEKAPNLYTADGIRVSVTPKRIEPPNGRTAVSIDRDDTHLTITALEPRSEIGRKAPPQMAWVARTATGVRSRLRGLRPEDAKGIERIDAKIESLEAKIAELHKQQGQLIKHAWSVGEVLKLNELNVKRTA